MRDSPFTSRIKQSLEVAWIKKTKLHKFNGENYYLWAPASHDKKRVEDTAQISRNAGYKANVIETKDGYEIYIRRNP